MNITRKVHELPQPIPLHPEKLRLVYDAARFATLDRSITTNASRGLVEELSTLTLAHETQHHPRKRARRKKDAESFNLAIAALAADLVSHNTNTDALGYMYRPTDREELAQTLVTSDAFEKLRLYWNELGYMEETTFAHFRSTMDEGDETRNFRRARRFRATEKLIDLAQSFQITPKTISEHFERSQKHANILQVRASKGGSPSNPTAGKLLKPKGPIFRKCRL